MEVLDSMISPVYTRGKREPVDLSHDPVSVTVWQERGPKRRSTIHSVFIYTKPKKPKSKNPKKKPKTMKPKTEEYGDKQTRFNRQENRQDNTNTTDQQN